MEDDEIKKELLDGIGQQHPEDTPPPDPFATDALGHTPAEEDDSGSD